MNNVATILAIVLFGLSVAVAVGIGGLRVSRRVRDRRRARRAARPRRAVLALAAGDPDQPDTVERLVNMPATHWRAVEPTMFELLSKVRGESRAAVAEVFRRRGLVARAHADLRQPGPVRRARAASALGSLGDPAAVVPISLLLADRHPDVRVAAVHALGRIGDPAAAPALLASLTSPYSTPSQLVAHALVQLGPATVPDLVDALASESPLARATVLDALRLLGAAETEPRVAALLAGDTTLEVRLRAAQTLGRIGTRAATAPLLAAAGPDRPARLRAAAAQALGELGDPAAVPSLVALLSGPDHRTAATAAAALLRLGPAGHTALSAACQQTGDAGGRAAAHAREALALAALASDRERRLPRPLAQEART